MRRTGKNKRRFWSLEDASIWAQRAGVTSQKDWFCRCKNPSFRPSEVPACPPATYGAVAFNAFGGWGGFLGTGRQSPITIRKQTVGWAEASAWAKQKGVASCTDWFARVKSDKSFLKTGIPRNPASFYGDEFRAMGGWPAFLGHQKLAGQSKIERIIRRAFAEVFDCNESIRQQVPVEGHRSFAVDMVCHSKKLIVEYDGVRFHSGDKAKERDRRKTSRLVKAGWMVVRVREHPLPLLRKEWDVSVNLRDGYADRASVVLKHLACLVDRGLISGGSRLSSCLNKKSTMLNSKDYTDILSIGRRSLDDASKWAKSMGVASSIDWRRRKKDSSFLPADIPANPDRDYGNEFRRRGGWGWFLGTGVVAGKNKKYRSLFAARRWAVSQGFKNAASWFAASQRGDIPSDIHKQPHQFDSVRFKAKGGWGWFLGTGNISNNNRQWRPIEEAMVWLAKRGVNSIKKWRLARSWKNFPKDIPISPATVYGKAFRDVGGMGGFLNTGRAFRRGGGWRTIEQASEWAQAQGIRTLKEWRTHVKDPSFLPHDIPAALHCAYREDLRRRGGTRWFFGASAR
jgi:very-short-patch-repair endonuclease